MSKRVTRYGLPAGLLLAGLVTALACGPRGDKELTALSKEAITTTYNVQVTLPTGSSLVDTTVGAAGSVVVEASDRVLGPIATGTGPVHVEAFGTTSGITTAGSVVVDPAATVNGNIIAGGAIQVGFLANVNGTQTPFSGTTTYMTSWSVTNSAISQGPITLLNNAIANPSPGAFGAVTVYPGSSLYLSTGTYFFQSLDLERGATLYVDSRNGPVFVYLASTIAFHGTETSVDAGTPQLFLGYFGTADAVLDAPFTGVFLAPNAKVRLDGEWCLLNIFQQTVNAASFYGLSVAIDENEVIKPSSFDWTTVPGMPPPPGGWAANGGPNGTGAPGSGATGSGANGGGTGPGGAAQQTIAMGFPSAVDLNVSLGSNGSTGTATSTPSAPVPFHLPQSFEVGGELANGTVTISFTDTSGTLVTCTYAGGSSSATPTTVLDLEAGRTATFVSCSDGQAVGAQRFGTNFSTSVQPVPGWPVNLHLSLDDRACDTVFDLLTPYQTKSMHDNFQWSSAQTVSPNADGTPSLFYAWVYVRNASDVLFLRKLYVHILSRPLFNQELSQYNGKCGTFRNPGDGTGVFLPVLMPDTVYNVLVNVTKPQFQKANNLKPGAGIFFDAVILRNNDVPALARNPNGSVKFNFLKNSGFRYLNYEKQPLPAQADMTLSSGQAIAILQDVATFVLGAVKSVGQSITSALGSLDSIFAGRVTFTVTLNVANQNPNFGRNQPIVRAWGPKSGLPLGAGGLQITLMENMFSLFDSGFGLIPETFISNTDDNGAVSIRVAQHGQGNVRGSGICVQLSNEAAWLTDFLMPNDVCDFTGYDSTQQSASLPVSEQFQITDFNEDRQIDLVANERYLSVIYQMTDAHNWLKNVAGYPTRTAHVLTGAVSDALSLPSDNRALTHCFRIRNESLVNAGQIVKQLFLGPWGYPASEVDILTTVFGGTFANNDISMPQASANGDVGNGGREVGSHEYGHFALCNLLLDADPSAIDDLVIDSVGLIVTRGDDLTYPTRYINEAFADVVSGQVTSVANYAWLMNQQGPDNNKVCAAGGGPCYDNNFTGFPANKKDRAGIARIASLIHDAFDGHANAKGVNGMNVPNDADAWALSNGSYTYTSAPYGNTDGPNPSGTGLPSCRAGTGPGATLSGSMPPACKATENVSLDGKWLVTFGKTLASHGNPMGPYLDDTAIYTSLDQTMVSAGINWCQRCAVLALHSPENSNDDQGPQQVLQLCTGGDSFLKSNSLPSGSPPEPNLRLDIATCAVCPPHTTSDANGVCQPCPYTVVGNTCVQCPADVEIDGKTMPLPFAQQWDSTTSVAGDTCPNIFWLQVDNADALFPRGGAKIADSIFLAKQVPSLCQQPYELIYEPLQTGGFLSSADQLVDATGTFNNCAPPCLTAGCNGLPSYTIAAGGLPAAASGGVTIRFGMTGAAGVNMLLQVPLPPPPTM